jgi:hypothetical protein
MKNLLVLGPKEDVKQTLDAVSSIPLKHCGCPCHSGEPGFWHCFDECCDLPGVLIEVQVHTTNGK